MNKGKEIKDRVDYKDYQSQDPEVETRKIKGILMIEIKIEIIVENKERTKKIRNKEDKERIDYRPDY